MISYAQNFEDVILWRALKDVQDGFYVDVGANHPVNSSVTKWFYDNGWSGINIEPHPICYELLCLNRPRDINLQIAISSIVEEIDFYLLNADGLSTASLGIANLHLRNGFSYDAIKVKTDTLGNLINDYAKREIHFLKIDIEGFEQVAISTLDLVNQRPWIICVEATKPMTIEPNYSEWEELLLDGDYIFCYEDGLNRFYLCREKEYLFPRFSLPPGIFDDFIMHHESNDELSAEVSRLKNELSNIRSSISWRITKPFRYLSRVVQRFR